MPTTRPNFDHTDTDHDGPADTEFGNNATTTGDPGPGRWAGNEFVGPDGEFTELAMQAFRRIGQESRANLFARYGEDYFNALAADLDTDHDPDTCEGCCLCEDGRCCDLDCMDDDTVTTNGEGRGGGSGGPRRIGGADDPEWGFEDSEGLRALLIELDAAGDGAWQGNPVATALMVFTKDKYTALARKHGMDPWDAASAAFEIMQADATRYADDPWAVVTRAVKVTCVAEERGQGMLCSTAKARKPKFSIFHDAERFSDRETPLADYHPAFHVHPFDQDDNGDGSLIAALVEPVIDLDTALDLTVELLVLLGWEGRRAQATVAYLASRLAKSASRAAAYEALRRDKYPRAFLDLTRDQWTGLLRVVLGNPDPHLTGMNASRGVLLRLLLGEPLSMLLRDLDLVYAIKVITPARRRWDS